MSLASEIIRVIIHPEHAVLSDLHGLEGACGKPNGLLGLEMGQDEGPNELGELGLPQETKCDVLSEC